jgi:hypothetical protein
MAEITKAYIDMQICEMNAATRTMDIQADAADMYPISPIPRVSHTVHSRVATTDSQQMRIMQKYDDHTVVPPLDPNCFSTNAVKNKLVPLESKGWGVFVILHVRGIRR